MSGAREMEHIVNNIFSSYETRIQSTGEIFNTTHQLLKGFQESFLDTKQEREKINAALRENLARNGSLRRKDFDNMMQGILSIQDKREKEVRNLLNSYLNEQREMAQALRERLERFKDSLARGEALRLKEFQSLIKEILAKQDERKDEVTSGLKQFQKEQKILESRLKELLAKGNELRIRDFKLMLKEFKAQHRERIARQEKRRQEVRSMLGDFKKEKIEAAKNWHTMQIKLAYKRAASNKGVNLSAPKEGAEK